MFESVQRWAGSAPSLLQSMTTEAARKADLADSFASVLHAVWEAERDWKLQDRIDLSLRTQRRAKHSAQ